MLLSQLQRPDIKLWESNHIKDFYKLYNFTGKNILEVGGRLPKDLINVLGAESWTSIDPANPNEEDGNYSLIKGSICDYPFKENSFDIIFSTNCFEHIDNLEAAFSNMYRILKPEGVLSALMGPIWSSNKGYHLVIFDEENNLWIDFNQTPIPEWSHLIYQPEELRDVIKDKYPAKVVDKIIYDTYVSNNVNRLFYEDYINIVNNSNFLIHELRNWHEPIALDKDMQGFLEKKYPDKKNFSTRSLKILLQKVL
jgi:SAM-dependent methyltransferase